jgi:ACS family sodium-dependent inorganic phosphate cotransporter
VLNIMVILGFMFNYMLRVNLTIAIVAMVMPSNRTDSYHSPAAMTECSDPSNTTLLSNEPAQQPEVR